MQKIEFQRNSYQINLQYLTRTLKLYCIIIMQLTNKRFKAAAQNTKSLIPNMVLSIKNKMKSYIKHGKGNHLKFSLIDHKHQKWTAAAELILIYLKFHYEASSSQKLFFTKLMAKLFEGWIKFRSDKISRGQRVQFHSANKKLLEIAKETLQNIFNSEILPKSEIEQILNSFIGYDGENKRSVGKQKKYIQYGLEYILAQFPLYQNQREQLPQGQNQQTNVKKSLISTCLLLPQNIDADSEQSGKNELQSLIDKDDLIAQNVDEKNTVMQDLFYDQKEEKPGLPNILKENTQFFKCLWKIHCAEQL